jgi:TPP-dependent pyruvate/acetoin dehydrogenase alpha subunit
MTYRQRGHVGPDDNVQGRHTDIRPKTEILSWLRKDPINRYERFLSNKGTLDRTGVAEIRKEVEREVADAHSFARSSEYPDKGDLAFYVYRKQNA